MNFFPASVDRDGDLDSHILVDLFDAYGKNAHLATYYLKHDLIQVKLSWKLANETENHTFNVICKFRRNVAFYNFDF